MMVLFALSFLLALVQIGGRMLVCVCVSVFVCVCVYVCVFASHADYSILVKASSEKKRTLLFQPLFLFAGDVTPRIAVLFCHCCRRYCFIACLLDFLRADSQLLSRSCAFSFVCFCLLCLTSLALQP
ncbi:hypothetical protein GQ42DRAFT_32452 [Ramicandelaber brevisporus]|nr:hypothetical protein GQ42DRAFT_32452 [Ramicandelaber brevisporus]